MRISDSPYSGYFFALLAATCWSLIGIFSRIPIASGITPLEVAFWRALSGGLCFLAHGLASGAWRVGLWDALAFIVFGVCNLGIFFIAYSIAIERSGAALGAVLLYTAPMWVVIFAHIFFKEQLTPCKIAALLGASAGVSLLSLSGGGMPGGGDLWGVICGLAAGFLYAMHFLFGKIYFPRVSPITIYMYGLLAGSAAMLPLVDFAPARGPADWAALCGLGLICTYTGYQFYCAGMKRLEAGRMAVICNLEPVLAIILAMLLWDERFSALGGLGMILVLGGVLLVMLDKKK
ncbi:MAG: DMT family transporter [Deltaproteobacteria bacterium]|jgi:drug/metabolite transporter (DMT)-like permease|nr:DMT family transporter [Deltaproteobacteria bacterium]